MKKSQKQPVTYSVSDAAALTGYHPQWIYRLCRAGKIGHRVLIPETGEHRFRISKKEISRIKRDKTQGKRQSCKKT